MQLKQNEAIEDCDQILISLEEIKKDIETTQSISEDEEVCSKISDNLELYILLNKQT